MRSLFLLLILFATCVGRAQTTNVVAITPSVASTSASTVAENVPVPVPEPSAKAVRHYWTGNIFWCARTAWEIALPAAFLFCGLSARLRDFARRIGSKWYFALCIYFVGLLLLDYGVNWPVSYYLGFVRPHAYGLSEQTFAKWFGDSLKELAVSLVCGVVLLWVPYLLLKKSPRRWWLYAGLAMVPFYFFVMMLRPVVFDPLFNEFTPVENKALEAKVLALAERAGIHGSRVFEVKKSVDTKTVNAYVTGFMGTKRIVLWDTILDKLDEHELMFVVGHEMGHYALGHVVKGILFLSALTLVALYGIHRVGNALIARWQKRLGFDQLSDMASLPLLVLLINVFSLALTPIGFAYGRHLEHEADRFGLELTHYNHSAATGFTRLLDEDLLVPRPGFFYQFWRGTHPTVGERIDFFNSYMPWEKGLPSKYEKYFVPEGRSQNAGA